MYLRELAVCSAYCNGNQIADIGSSISERSTPKCTSPKPKPEQIIADKIVPGRLEKSLKEICLLSQQFVKNPDQTVEAYVAGAKSKVVTFIRLAVGEGIEKQEVDFAAEVAAQSAAFNK